MFVENFRPGTIERAGFGWDAVHERFPRLVYASISGYGQTGPRRDEAGYDAVMQAEGGLMSVTGDPRSAGLSPWRRDHRHGGGPVLRAGHHRGAARARADRRQASASTSACSTRRRRCSPTRPRNWFATGKIPQRQGNRHATIAPYETFTHADGEIVIAVGNDAIWQRFCPAIGLPELAADPRFRTNRDRMANYDELRAALDEVLVTRTRADWTGRFHAASVPCGSVRDVAEVLADPQLHAREMVGILDHPTVGPTRVMGTPIKLSETPGTLRTPPPTLGQHTTAVLEELGYDQEMIASLKAAGAI